jgi:HSP20 family protein
MSSKALTRADNQVATVFDDFFRPFNEWFNSGGPLMRTLSVPSVNISEDTDQYKVALAAPGLKKSDFRIEVDGNMITVSSEKEEKKDEKEARFKRHEYSYSSFRRSFTLPDDVNKDKIEALYTDGILTVSIPKSEEAKNHAATKMITVK